MKTNLTHLMSIVDEEEKNFAELLKNLRNHAYTSSIQELDGKINITEDYKSDFEEEFAECKESQRRITIMKAAIFSKNNEFKLSDGRTIQEAIVDNTNLRKMKATFNNLVNLRGSKDRVTEVHNSYFDCRTLNYGIKEMKSELQKIEKTIEETDFEISKLNSIEFEIEL